MKKILALLLTLVMLLGMFAGCRKDEPAPTDPTQAPEVTEPAADVNLEKAIEYLRVFYKDAESKVTMDYDRIGTVRVAGQAYDVVWTVDIDGIIVPVKNEDGTWTIDIDEEAYKNVKEDMNYKLTATITGTDGRELSYSWDMILPAYVDPIEIVKAAYALKPGEALEGTYTLTGKIIAINTPYDEGYKNVSVTIVVEGAEDMPIMCYRLKGEGADELFVDDIITVTGAIKNYKGTIEFDQGCILEEVIPGPRVPVEVPDDPRQIVEDAFKLPSGATLYEGLEVTLSGTVSEVTYSYTEKWGTISADLYVYGKIIDCYKMGGNASLLKQVSAGDYITVRGVIKNYFGTIEFVEPTLVGLTNNPPPIGTTDQAKIQKDANKLSSGGKLWYNSSMTGIVSQIVKKDTAAGTANLYLYVEGLKVNGQEPERIYVYKGMSDGNVIKNLQVGDKVRVTGYITNYMGGVQYNQGSYVTLLEAGVGMPVPDVTYAAEIVTDPKPDTLYKLSLVQKDMPGKPTLFLTGEMSTYYLGTTQNGEYAADVKLVETAAGSGKYYLAIAGDTTKYINIRYEKGDDGKMHDSVYIETKAETAYTFDKTYNTLKCSVGGTDYFIGTYTKSDGSTYSTFSARKWENVAQEMPVHLSTIVEITGEASLEELVNKLESDIAAGADGITNALPSKVTVRETSVDLTWSLTTDNAAAVQLKDNKLNRVPQDSGAVAYTLKTTITLGEESQEVTVSGVVAKKSYAPVMGTEYKMEMVQMELYQVLYFNGKLDGNYLATTTEFSEAVTVVPVASGNGMKLSFKDGNTTKYINVVNYTDEDGSKWKMDLGTDAAAATVYTYNETYGILETVVGDNNPRYLGTHSTYDTISSSWSTYVDASNIDVSQFAARLVTEATKLPEKEEEEIPDYAATVIEGAPVAGTAYKWAVVQGKLAGDPTLYFTGVMDGYYPATTKNAEEAADVILETADGGYYLSFTDKDGAKKYVNLAPSGKYINIKFEDAPKTVYAYNATIKTLTSEVTINDGGEKEVTAYIGTYGTNDDFRGSDISYITGDKAGDLDTYSFPARLVTVQKLTGPASAEEIKSALEVLMAEGADGITNALPSEVTVRETTAQLTWSLDTDNAEAVKLGADNKLTLVQQKKEVPYSLTATFTLEEGTDSYTVDRTLAKLPEPYVTEASKLSTTATYQLGLIHETGDKAGTWLFNGSLDGKYGDTSKYLAYAADVKLETAEGGYYLSFADPETGAKKYLNFASDGNYAKLAIADAPETVYTFDDTMDTLVTQFKDSTYYMNCGYSYTTISADSRTADRDPVHLFTMTKEEAPADPKKTVDAALQLEAGEALTYADEITGTVTAITEAYNSEHDNISVKIKTLSSAGAVEILARRFSGEGVELIEVGDVITVEGLFENYNGAVQLRDGTLMDRVAIRTGSAEEALARLVSQYEGVTFKNGTEMVSEIQDGQKTFTVTWSFDNGKASVSEGKLVLGEVTEDVTVKISAKVVNKDDETESAAKADFGTVEIKAPTTDPDPEPSTPTMVTAPVAGTAYKLGLVHGGLNNKLLYFNGTSKEGYAWYMMTSEEWSEGVDVKLVAVTGGYNLAFGEDKFLNIVPDPENGKIGLSISDEAVTVYTYDTEYNTLKAVVNETGYFIGTYGTHNTLSASNWDTYVASNYVVHLYTLGAGDSGDGDQDPDPDPSTGDAVLLSAAPAAGDTVIIYSVQGGAAVSTQKNSYNLGGVAGTVTEGKLPVAEKMAQFTVVVDGDGNYAFKAADGYLSAVTSGSYTNVVLSAELTDNGKWELAETASGSGKFYLKNVAVKYGEKDQYLEYYNSAFAVYGLGDDNAIFEMQFFKTTAGTTPDPDPDPNPDPNPDPDPTTATLVTDWNQLSAGAKVIIAATNSAKAMGATGGNYFKEVDAAKGDGTITVTSDMEVLTLELGSTATTYAFKNTAGYLCPSTGTDNHLKTQSAKNDVSSFEIRFDGSVADITCVASNVTKGWLRHNSDNTRFACYGSGQNDVSIYLVEAGNGTRPTQPKNLTLTPAEIKTAIASLGENESIEGEQSLTGTITEIDTTSITWGAIGKIQVEGYDDWTMSFYGLKGTGYKDLVVGDKITISGIIIRFVRDTTDQIQFNSNCTFVKAATPAATSLLAVNAAAAPVAPAVEAEAEAPVEAPAEAPVEEAPVAIVPETPAEVEAPAEVPAE